jgi:hypothetical protein
VVKRSIGRDNFRLDLDDSVSPSELALSAKESVPKQIISIAHNKEVVLPGKDDVGNVIEFLQ